MSEVPDLLVVVTGLSGAGKSTALHALEDLGFFCVDNLPTPVVAETLRACAEGGFRRIAFGIDVRVGSFLDGVSAVIDGVSQGGESEVVVVFLDASDEALLRRFSGTRRPHPLSTAAEPGGEAAASAVIDGIRIERERLASLRARASLIVDTTSLSVHELRRRIVSRFAPGSSAGTRMRTRFVSFGFKYGAPVDADMLLDVRFLQNPFFEESLRDLPGTLAPVREFVLRQPDAQAFLAHAVGLLRFCLPRYASEGKSYLTVAVGCTGGRHRSVVVAEYLRSTFAADEGLAIEVVHRDVERVDEHGRISDVGPPGTVAIREVPASVVPPRVGGSR